MASEGSVLLSDVIGGISAILFQTSQVFKTCEVYILSALLKS